MNPIKSRQGLNTPFLQVKRIKGGSRKWGTKGLGEIKGPNSGPHSRNGVEDKCLKKKHNRSTVGVRRNRKVNSEVDRRKVSVEKLKTLRRC